MTSYYDESTEMTPELAAAVREVDDRIVRELDGFPQPHAAAARDRVSVAQLLVDRGIRYTLVDDDAGEPVAVVAHLDDHDRQVPEGFWLIVTEAGDLTTCPDDLVDELWGVDRGAD